VVLGVLAELVVPLGFQHFLIKAFTSDLDGMVALLLINNLSTGECL